MDKLVSKEIINKRAAERLGSGRRATGDGRGRGHSGAFGAKNTIRQGFGGEALPRCGFRRGKPTQMWISRNRGHGSTAPIVPAPPTTSK